MVLQLLILLLLVDFKLAQAGSIFSPYAESAEDKVYIHYNASIWGRYEFPPTNQSGCAANDFGPYNTTEIYIGAYPWEGDRRNATDTNPFFFEIWHGSTEYCSHLRCPEAIWEDQVGFTVFFTSDEIFNFDFTSGAYIYEPTLPYFMPFQPFLDFSKGNLEAKDVEGSPGYILTGNESSWIGPNDLQLGMEYQGLYPLDFEFDWGENCRDPDHFVW